MTVDEIDLRAWHADGHKLGLGLTLFAARGGRSFGQVAVRVECPEDSVCHRWYAAHGTEPPKHHCMVGMEIEAMGPIDFIDADLDAEALPADWSRWGSDFPIEIEWRDRGEDGLEWRPLYYAEATEPKRAAA